MSTPGPFGGSNPLDKLLRDLLNVLSTGPVNWDVARQVAQAAAAEVCLRGTVALTRREFR